MALNISDPGVVVTPNPKVQPFKTFVPASLQNANTQTLANDLGTADAAVANNQTFTADQASGVSVVNMTTTNSNQVTTDGVTETSSSQTSIQSVTQTDDAGPPTRFLITDTLDNNSYSVTGTDLTGFEGVGSQYIVQTDNPTLSTANLNITALTPGVFIHTGSGMDAISVAGVGGTNILDGGTNSNYLVGGSAGSGTDTFFIDARGAGSDVWSTISGFHAGDAVTLVGVTPASKAITWVDGEGAAGATGLTLHATEAGAPEISFTLAGYTTADLSNGRLGTTYGTEPDGTPYLYVVGLA